MRNSGTRKAMLGIIFGSVLSVCLLASSVGSAHGLQPNIVILNSYTREFSWTDNQTQGIMDAYWQAGFAPEFYIEYLDWKRNPTQENLQFLYQLFQLKYTQQPIDIIMTTDAAALEFALAYRKELFSDAPIVYSGIDPDAADEIVQGQERVIGVLEVLDVDGTLAIMQRFNPSLQSIYLIYDDTESGLAAKAQLERAVNNLSPKVAVHALHNESYREIIDILRTAPDNSAALIATYSRDGDGVVMELERYVQLFSQESRVPLYVLYDFEIGSGAVGGSVLSGYLQGKKAAELGVAILNQDTFSVVSPRVSISPVTVLDYQQIQRYGLRLDQVPVGATLLNRPQSFYEQNKTVIWITVGIFCFMAISIIILALNIRKRKLAEASLRLSNAELAATYEETVASQEELQAQYEQLERIQHDLNISEERYKYLAYHDPLTGLWNRAAINEKLQNILSGCSDVSSGAILYIDLDNFKNINDTFGHSLGDQLLVRIGQRLTAIIGSDGDLARLGGDEFIILLYGISREKAAYYAELILMIFRSPLHIDEKKMYVTFSIGISMFPEDGNTVEEIQRITDFAMYQAKEQGKNRYLFFNHAMELVMREKMLLERELREAIVNNELRLWFQPFVLPTTRQVVGFEALLRWHSPTRGMIPPSKFIDIAEKTGLIVLIGRKVLQDACRFIATLHKEGYADLQVSINISPVQLLEDDFCQMVWEIIGQTGVSPHALGFEITESIFLDYSHGLIEKLQWLKQLGISILLDDFGSGYSSLQYLHRLPIDVVKIDKSFIDDLQDDATNQLTEVIIALARKINAKTVAEGVETEKQLQKLIHYQCEFAQGYLFSQPIPEEAVRSLLVSTDKTQH